MLRRQTTDAPKAAPRDILDDPLVALPDSLPSTLPEPIMIDASPRPTYLDQPAGTDRADLDQIMMDALRVISNLNPDDKLVVTHDHRLQLDGSYLRSLSRYLRGQGRSVMIQFLEELVVWSRAKMLHYRLVKKPVVLDGLIEFHLQLGATLLKYHLLQETYQADPETSESLRVIREQLASVESILLEIRALVRHRLP